MNDRGPIFLQALWRARSTYFWTKFRENPDLRCFKEPFHENLLTFSEANFASDPNERVSLRHPFLKEHYFAEYEIAEGGGVPGFRKRYSAERYYMPANGEDRELAGYIKGLFNYAARNMQRPLLQPTRAVLRAEWMKASFGGAHIYLNRDFDELMNSYYSFRGKLGYFLRCFAVITGQNADNPLFHEIAGLKGLRPYTGETFHEEVSHFGELVSGWERQDFRDIVAFIWVLALAQASRYADLLIEGARMVNEEGYPDLITEQVAGLTGADLDLSDFNRRKSGDAEDLAVSSEAKEIIRRAADKLDPDWPRLEKLGMAKSTERFLDLVLAP